MSEFKQEITTNPETPGSSSQEQNTTPVESVCEKNGRPLRFDPNKDYSKNKATARFQDSTFEYRKSRTERATWTNRRQGFIKRGEEIPPEFRLPGETGSPKAMASVNASGSGAAKPKQQRRKKAVSSAGVGKQPTPKPTSERALRAASEYTGNTRVVNLRNRKQKHELRGEPVPEDILQALAEYEREVREAAEASRSEQPVHPWPAPSLSQMNNRMVPNVADYKNFDWDVHSNEARGLPSQWNSFGLTAAGYGPDWNPHDVDVAAELAAPTLARTMYQSLHAPAASRGLPTALSPPSDTNTYHLNMDGPSGTAFIEESRPVPRASLRDQGLRHTATPFEHGLSPDHLAPHHSHSISPRPTVVTNAYSGGVYDDPGALSQPNFSHNNHGASNFDHSQSAPANHQYFGFNMDTPIEFDPVARFEGGAVEGGAEEAGSSYGVSDSIRGHDSHILNNIANNDPYGTYVSPYILEPPARELSPAPLPLLQHPEEHSQWLRDEWATVRDVPELPEIEYTKLLADEMEELEPIYNVQNGDNDGAEPPE